MCWDEIGVVLVPIYSRKQNAHLDFARMNCRKVVLRRWRSCWREHYEIADGSRYLAIQVLAALAVQVLAFGQKRWVPVQMVAWEGACRLVSSDRVGVHRERQPRKTRP